MPWATFNRVIQLYVFDRELRSILLDAIERIEVSLRCRIVYEYCHLHGNNWYENAALFYREHAKFMKLVSNELNNSKETFIQHYRSKYTHPPNPPAWMAMEVLSFGQMSTMFKNLKTDNAKKAVASHFGISLTILESWMEHLVYIRNLCAHHSRVWNRTMTVKPTIPSNTTYPWIKLPFAKPDKIYTTISILAYLLERVTTKAPFTGRIRTLLHRFKDINNRASGFSAKWESDPFWKSIHVPVTHHARIIVFKCMNVLKKRKPMI